MFRHKKNASKVKESWWRSVLKDKKDEWDVIGFAFSSVVFCCVVVVWSICCEQHIFCVMILLSSCQCWFRFVFFWRRIFTKECSGRKKMYDMYLVLCFLLRLLLLRGRCLNNFLWILFSAWWFCWQVALLNARLAIYLSLIFLLVPKLLDLVTKLVEKSP